LLPINRKKVLFSSYWGRGYSDSPKAIAEELLASGQDLQLCWLVKSVAEAASLPAEIKPVFNKRLPRILAISTSKVWVDNCRKCERKKRSGQRYLQTWHGFALKKIERDAEDVLEPVYVRNCKLDSSQIDLIVSGSQFMTGIYRDAFWYDGEIENYGTPRNDVFFRDTTTVVKKVHNCLQLPQECRLVLYAPTFRADHSLDAYALDAERVCKACAARFGGEWAVLIRLHPNVADKSGGLFRYDGKTILDATAYPDMQELLIAADVLITDYSSSMFDYALQNRPVLQFAIDIEEYKKDRGFYFQLDALPFPLATSNEALDELIRSYDSEKQQEKWEQFKTEQGFCEDGQAAKRCADWILEQMKG